MPYSKRVGTVVAGTGEDTYTMTRTPSRNKFTGYRGSCPFDELKRSNALVLYSISVNRPYLFIGEYFHLTKKDIKLYATSGTQQIAIVPVERHKGTKYIGCLNVFIALFTIIVKNFRKPT